MQKMRPTWQTDYSTVGSAARARAEARGVGGIAPKRRIEDEVNCPTQAQ
jgi:hypothetical protein